MQKLINLACRTQQRAIKFEKTKIKKLRSANDRMYMEQWHILHRSSERRIIITRTILGL